MPSKTPKTSLAVSRRNEYLLDIADAYGFTRNLVLTYFPKGCLPLFNLCKDKTIFLVTCLPTGDG